jgi:hypothetical protein
VERLIPVPRVLLWDYETPPEDLLWRLRRVGSWFPAVGRDRETVRALFEHRFRRVSAEHGDKVVFNEVSTLAKGAMLAHCQKDAVFIDGKELSPGPPPTEEKVRRILAKRVARLR